MKTKRRHDQPSGIDTKIFFGDDSFKTQFSVTRMNAAMTRAEMDSVPLELENLEALCGEFDTICQLRSHMSDPDTTFLAQLEDELWVLTRRICAGIELVQQNSVHPSDLEVFRRDTFVPKVLRWYRMNDELKRIWNKPAGYSGDYRTIELLCQNDASLEHFNDIFIHHVLRCNMAFQHRTDSSITFRIG